MQVNTKFLEADVVSSDADIGEETGTTEMKALEVFASRMTDSDPSRLV